MPSSPSQSTLVDLLVELGLDHFDCLRILLLIANIHHLVVVHRDEPPHFIRDFQSALLLQILEDRVYQVVPARLQVGQQFERITRTLKLRVGPKHLHLSWVPHCPEERRLSSGLSRCTVRRIPRTTPVTLCFPFLLLSPHFVETHQM